jgi:hypothetical protein
MNITTYLIIEGRSKYNGFFHKCAVVATRSNKPARTKNQVAVKLTLEVPDNLFEDFVPECSARIAVNNVLGPGIEAAIDFMPKDDLDKLAELITKRQMEIELEEKSEK